jgi:RNA polymerase sigma factor (sigma-70 family)
MSTSIARGRIASLHEHALLCAAQAGDRRAQEELLRRYEPMVRQIVRRLRLPWRCPRADLAQEGRIALVGAIRAWESARGPFYPFAVHCVRTKTANALATARARKHQPLSRASSLDYSPPLGDLPDMSEADNSPLMWLDSIPSSVDGQPTARTDPLSALLVREQLAAIRAGWGSLTGRERAVVAGVLGGKSYRQLAGELDCTVKAVEGAQRRGRRKLTAEQELLAA